MTLMSIVMAQNNAGSDVQNLTVLKQDNEITDLALYNGATIWGRDAFSVGEAVKFTAPKPGWKLRQIRVAGWNGFNETNKTTIPPANDFLIEIRDQNLNLLYRTTDTQNAYFTYPVPILRGIDIPALSVTGDFYVVFYDRGFMYVGMERENGTGNSYFYDSRDTRLIPASFNDTNGKSTKVNWVIRAVGE